MCSSRQWCRQLRHAEVNSKIVGKTLKKWKLRHKSISRLKRFDEYGPRYLASHCRMKRFRDWLTYRRKAKQRKKSRH